MRAQTVIDPEAVVLQILKEPGPEVSATNLLQKAKDKGFGDDAMLKAAIWQLISESEIELTPKRTLRLTVSSQKKRAATR